MADFETKNTKIDVLLNAFFNKYLRFFQIFILLLILFFGYRFFLKSEYAKISQVKSEIRISKTEQIKQMKQYIASLEELKKTLEAFKQNQQSNLTRFLQILPSSPDLSNLIAQLETIFRTSGFIFETLPFSQAPSADNPSLMTVDLNFQVVGGNYSQFKAFLNNLQNNIRLIDVKAISFNKPKDQTSYSLDLNTYYFKD
jgi:Tfp pilus assembly protein PilO